MLSNNDFLSFFSQEELDIFEKDAIFGLNQCLVITKEYYFEIFCSLKKKDLTIYWISNKKKAETNLINKNKFLTLLKECTIEQCHSISVEEL